MSLSVLRIKRRINENPEEVLQKAQKKKQFLFTFKATGVTKEESKRLMRKEAKNLEAKKAMYKLAKPTKKAKAKLTNNSKKKRAELVNKNRTIKTEVSNASGSSSGGYVLTEEDKKFDKALFAVLDITADDDEDPTSDSDNDDEYVYDLYFNTTAYLTKDDFMGFTDFKSNNDWLDKPGEMEKFEYYSDHESDDDSDDSNKESNWRNDYPETGSDDHSEADHQNSSGGWEDLEDHDDDWKALYSNADSGLDNDMAGCCLEKGKTDFPLCAKQSGSSTFKEEGKDDDDKKDGKNDNDKKDGKYDDKKEENDGVKD